MALQPHGQKGLTLIELIMIAGIILLISAIAIPNVTTLLDAYRLDASGRVTASLLQQARMQAVRNNVPAYVQYDTTKSPNLVFVNSDPSVAYASGNPDVEITSGTFQTDPTKVDHTTLDSLLNNGNAGATKLFGTVAFNSRGLPCVEGAAAVLCSNVTAPYFEWFIQGPRGGWEAVTVSPAGRVKAWRMTSTKGCGQGGANACWQ